MMKEFYDWWYKYPTPTYDPLSTEDIEAAYIAGWNACRDKWGGVDYDLTLKDFNGEN